MVNQSRCRRSILLAALAVLALRAFTPEGYMPAAPGSGLLFELCPEGVPAEVMQALSGGGHHHHHHDEFGTTDGTPATADCPIGHMLSSAFAHDAGGDADVAPDTPVWIIVGAQPSQARRLTRFRSRAPPA